MCPLPLRAPLDARLGSPHDQDRRDERPVRRARTHDPRRLRRIRPPHARDPYGTQATEPAPRCFRRQRRLRMQREQRVMATHDRHPEAPHRSHSPSLRGPRHLAESPGFLRARSRDPRRVFRLDACVDRDAFDRLLPPKPLTASTHVSCVPSFFFRGLRLVLAREGWDPQRLSSVALAFALAPEESSPRGLGPLDAARLGNRAFHDARLRFGGPG